MQKLKICHNISDLDILKRSIENYEQLPNIVDLYDPQIRKYTFYSVSIMFLCSKRGQAVHTLRHRLVATSLVSASMCAFGHSSELGAEPGDDLERHPGARLLQHFDGGGVLDAFQAVPVHGQQPVAAPATHTRHTTPRASQIIHRERESERGGGQTK